MTKPDKIFKLMFAKDAEVDLDLIAGVSDNCKYQVRKLLYDVAEDKTYTLTMTVELTKMTQFEKKYAAFLKCLNGKCAGSIEIKSKGDNNE